MLAGQVADCCAMNSAHCATDLVRIFNGLFAQRYRTRLVGGADEPLYQPPQGLNPARIWFRSDYFASALHEVAHWCIAGAARRQLEDYGYWYEPEGRGPELQARFEQVEAVPQALEWLFSDAAAFHFQPSFDNPGESAGDSLCFIHALQLERRRREKLGLPPRARQFREALRAFYR